MSNKWKLILVVGLTVALVSVILSYAFPDISSLVRTIVIGATAALSCGISYKLFFTEVKKN